MHDVLLGTIIFHPIKKIVKIKTGYILIDFDLIYRMQSSEFTKSLNFESILKTTAKNKLKFFIFNLKIDFYKLEKYCFKFN